MLVIKFVANGAEQTIHCKTFEIVSLDGKTYEPEEHGMEMLRQWCKGDRGRMVRLAEHLGIAKSAFAGWRIIPRKHVDAISEFTGLPERVLRPDQGRE